MAPLAEAYKGFVIDLDGVIYLLHDPVEGSSQAVARLHSIQAPFVFLTNNSVSTPHQYVERLAAFDITVDESQIVTSSQAVGRYLDAEFDARGKRAVVIGERGLIDELERRGLQLLEAGVHEGADLVVVGWDRHFDFERLKAAVIAIRRGALFIATNADSTYPTPEGLWPGAGTMVAAVATGSGTRPIVVGKPNPFIVELALERLGLPRQDVLLIGDRLDSDVEAGIAAGVDTLLVLTGVSQEGDIEPSGTRPTHVREDLQGLFE